MQPTPDEDTTLDILEPGSEEELSARATIRQRLAEVAEAHPELSTAELADLFARGLPDTDRPLVESFLAAEARNILAWELRAHFSRVRRGIFGSLDLANKDAPQDNTAAAVERSDQARESVYERIAQWREFVPSQWRTKVLLDMNRVELHESAQYDAARAAAYGWKMIVKERLAEQLRNDAETVASRFSPEQVAAVIAKTRKDMTTGNFRLRIAPVPNLPRPAVRRRPIPNPRPPTGQ